MSEPTHCATCDAWLWPTSSGHAVCPEGHGRILLVTPETAKTLRAHWNFVRRLEREARAEAAGERDGRAGVNDPPLLAYAYLRAAYERGYKRGAGER